MEYWTLILTIVAGTLAIYYFFSRKLGNFEKLGIIHKKPWPIFGNMAGPLFRRSHLVDAIDEVYKLNEEADYVGFYDFGEPVIMIRSVELIKNITVKNFDHFVDHRGFVADPTMDPLFGKNLFSLRGDKWRDIRALLSPAFTSSKMKAMFKLMSNCGRNFADYLTERSIDKPNILNTKDAFTRYTNDVIATCAFGIGLDSMKNPKNDFYVLGRKSTSFEGLLSLKFFLLRSFPKIFTFFKVKLIDEYTEKFFEEVVRETIAMRDEKGITRPDMIQLMMESREKPNAPQLSIQDMTAQAFVFFFGGFDTSSQLMCFVAHMIACNKDIHRRVQEEVDEVLQATNGEPTYEAVNGMQYLEAVMNETLRLYTPAIFLDRVCVKTFELPPAYPGAKPITIEPGTNIWFPVYSLHRDPKYFSEPEKFDPERFIGDKNYINPYAYIPFGVGPRSCIGNRFALLETKVVLFHLLAKCNLKPSPKTQINIEFSKGSFALVPKRGHWLQLEARKGV